MLVRRLHRRGELGLIEIAGSPPRVEDVQAEVDGVGSGGQGGL